MKMLMKRLMRRKAGRHRHANNGQDFNLNLASLGWLYIMNDGCRKNNDNLAVFPYTVNLMNIWLTNPTSFLISYPMIKREDGNASTCPQELFHGTQPRPPSQKSSDSFRNQSGRN
jgi:hypothetical protein